MVGSNEDDPSDVLYGVDAGWLFADGSFVVANRGSLELRFYDTNGASSVIVGGPGSGPGEFASFDLVDQAGDSLYVFDSRNGRLAILSARGQVGRHVLLPPASFVYGAFDSGAFLLGIGELPAMAEGLQRLHANYRIVERDGSESQLGRFFAFETHWVATGDGQELMDAGQPMGLHASTVTDGENWFYTAGESYIVYAYSREGELRRRLSHPSQPPKVTRDDLEHFLDAHFGVERRMSGLERAMRSVPLHERLPAYDRLLVDREGALWARPFASANSSVCWHVFERSDPGFALVCIPERLTVLDVGAEHVLAVNRGDNDVERVVRHRILER